MSAVIPVEGSSKLVALLDRKICLVDRSSGEMIISLPREELVSVFFSFVP